MKKLLALLLIIVMIVPLVACGPKQNGEYTTLKCVFLGKAPSNEALAKITEEVNKITREKIGAELEITFLDPGSMTEKLNVMMASGEQLDVVWTGYAFKYAQCVQNGGLYDITELLEQTPAILDHVPDYALEQCYIDGKLYGIPNMQNMSSYWSFVFPKALVEKYNFDYTKVTKVADLEPYLKLIKENEPGIYPICDANLLGGWADSEKFGEYLGPDGVDNVYVDLETGEFVMPMDNKNLIARWQRARDWYQKGYIRQDIMSFTDFDSAIANGLVGVWAVSGKPGLDSSLTEKYGFEVVTVPATVPTMGDATKTMLSVCSNTIDPLKSLQLIELLNDDVELHNLMVFGIEGVNYTRTEAGKVEKIKDSGYDQSAYSWAYGDQFITYLQTNQDDDLWEVTKKMNDAAEPSVTSTYKVPTDVKDEIKNEIALLSAIGGEYAKGLRYGTLDLNVVVPEYRSRMQDLFDEIKYALEPSVKEWLKTIKD